MHCLAFGFGSGLAPVAPGTFGTLVAIPPYLLLATLDWPFYLAAVVLALVAGIYICDYTSKALGVADHGAIVWDEIVGFWITMIAVPLAWQWIVAGFVLFRLFDIVKPWPIRNVDAKMKGGAGVMLDDVLAGLYALGCLQLALLVLEQA